MDDETKERALEKAKGMVEHIGYPQGIYLSINLSCYLYYVSFG